MGGMREEMALFATRGRSCSMPGLKGQTQTCDLSVEKEPPESGGFNQEREVSVEGQEGAHLTCMILTLSMFSLAAW